MRQILRVIYILSTAAVITLFAHGLSHADSRLALSEVSVSAENNKVVVTHEHSMRRKGGGNDGSGDGKITLLIESTLRFVPKTPEGADTVFEIDPLTALVNIDGGRYFAGLSNLKTLSHRYNFVLFDQHGRVLATALITADSGHCGRISQSTTNRIGWYDESNPEIRLVLDDGAAEVRKVVVTNPHDTGPDGTSGKCVIDIAYPCNGVLSRK